MSEREIPALLPCPFCGKAMMLRGALWPSEGDRDAIIHAEPTDCPLSHFSDDTFDESIIDRWNRRASRAADEARIRAEAAQITPEMIEDGILALNLTGISVPPEWSQEDHVTYIWQAMSAARARAQSGAGDGGAR